MNPKFFEGRAKFFEIRLMKLPDYYDVEELRIFSVGKHIEVRTTGKEISPSPMHHSFLLALISKYPQVVTYEELWKDVWRHKYEINEEGRAKIQTTKGQMIAWLKTNNVVSLVIESEPGMGYRLNNVVKPGWFAGDGTVGSWKELLFSNIFYIIAVALAYGILFQITEIMEVAYQLDIYGGPAIFGGVTLMLVNFAAILAACSSIVYRLYHGKSGLLQAIGIVFAAVIISILISGQVLPIQPITEAKFQTQPALIAFWKNALVYFFPLCVIFVLLPFYSVNVRWLMELKILKATPSDFIFIEPKWLLIICSVVLIISYVSTNYLLDQLNSDDRYHHVFVGFIFLRMFISFSLALGSLAWYYAKVTKRREILLHEDKE